jgi:hypothetical protein
MRASAAGAGGQPLPVPADAAGRPLSLAGPGRDSARHDIFRGFSASHAATAFARVANPASIGRRTDTG